MHNQAWYKENEAGKMFLLVVFYWFSLYVYVPYQSIFLAILGASSTLTGVVIGAYGYAQILLRLPLGAWADKMSNNNALLVAGTALPVVATMIRLLFETVPGYLLANVISGCGAAVWVTIMIDFAKRIEGRNLQYGTALVSAANQLGILLSFSLSLLLYRDGQMRGLMLASILAGLLATLLALSLQPLSAASPPSERLSSPPTSLKILKNRRLWLFSVFGFLQIGLVLSTAQSFSPRLCKALGGSDLQVGLMNVIFMTTSVVFSFLSATRLIKSLGAKVILPVAHVLMAIYCLFVPKLQSIPLLLAFQILGGIYAGVVVSFAVGEATKEIAKHGLNSAMALYQTLVALGIAFFPILTGYLVKISSISFSYQFLAGIALVAALYAAILTQLRVSGTAATESKVIKKLAD